MPTRVRFRFNKVTGEVEEFLVDDQDRRLPEAEHDRIALDVGQMVAANPRVHEALPATSAPRRAEKPPVEQAKGETETTPEDPEVE